MPFLTARWESLVLLSYPCPPALLEPLVPRGTEVDTWEGQALISVVGFLFRRTRLRGLSIPFHQTFEEVNLRFYVRRAVPGAPVRRAVVFLRELVPRWAVAAVARRVYNEPYLAVPMDHRVSLDPTIGGGAVYSWIYHGVPFELGAQVTGPAQSPAPDSEAAFITEHYWGYTRQRDGGTLEYRVEHPPWEVWPADACYFRGPATALYGPTFGPLLSTAPQSAFVAVGSNVAIQAGRRLALTEAG